MKKRQTLNNFVYGFLLLLVPTIFFLMASDILAQEGSGKIQGVIKSPYVKRFPALIFIDHVDGTYPPPAEKVHVSQKDLLFAPHINPILNGTTASY